MLDGAAVTTALLREVEDHTESDHDEGAHPEGSGLSAMFSMDENEVTQMRSFIYGYRISYLLSTLLEQGIHPF